MTVLWSEFLALWFDRTRRRALPLLLATLLLLIPSLPAYSDCCCEMPGEHHHEMAPCHDGDADDHENGEVHEHQHQHPVQAHVGTGRVQILTGNHMTVSRAEMACCFCSRPALSHAVVAVPVPSGVHADSQPLTYVRVSALPIFRFDALTGLFGRAGPEPNTKPKLLFLASLAGRAPPVSL